MGHIETTLRKARDLIKDPANWTRGCMGRTGANQPTAATGPYARKWCLLGAISRALPPSTSSSDIVSHMHKTTGMSLVNFNDRNKHHVVIAALGLAISRAKTLGI